jgi:hypothetical protein
MGFIDQRDSGLDEIDYVSTWILRLAIGMMVLGVVFAALDRWQLLPPLPGATAVTNADSPVASRPDSSSMTPLRSTTITVASSLLRSSSPLSVWTSYAS